MADKLGRAGGTLFASHMGVVDMSSRHSNKEARDCGWETSGDNGSSY